MSNNHTHFPKTIVSDVEHVEMMSCRPEQIERLVQVQNTIVRNSYFLCDFVFNNTIEAVHRPGTFLFTASMQTTQISCGW